MIIDIHSHIAYSKLYPVDYLTGMLSDPLQNLDDKKLSSLMSLLLKDKSCDQYVQQMDLAGIEKSVLLIIDGGVGMGEASMSIDEIFLIHRDVLLKFPERFIVFAGVDPRRGQSGFDLFKKSISEYGFRGLKLYPPMGYKPSDSRLDDYYQICEENRLAVLVHTGPSLKGLQNELANPKYIYNVACSFPGVNFILAHAGYNLLDKAIDDLISLPNVFLDIAGFQSLSRRDVKDKLELVLSEKYNSKVLFGSDWPLFNLMHPIKYHIDVIRSQCQDSNYQVKTALENLFYNNAQRALRIEK